MPSTLKLPEAEADRVLSSTANVINKIRFIKICFYVM